MKKVVFGVFLALSLLSCSLPIVRSGQAELEVSLGGVLPNISIEDIQYAEANRAITPNSLMVRAVITGEGYSRTFKAPVLAATTLIAGLPAFKELTITLEALDFEGTVTTSWSGKATLNPGRNSIKAVMKPEGAISVFPVGSGVSIPFGKAQFYKYTFGNSPGETFVYLETNNQEPLWMGVYNENWEPLDTITESRGDGWAVINLSTTPTVYFAVANMRNTGYPPGEKSYNLTTKQAIFVSTNGNSTNQGTSNSPWDIARMTNELGEFMDAAYFLSAGNYDTSSSNFLLDYQQWIFGGFDPSDWKKRTPRSTIMYTNSSSPAVTLDGSNLKLLDGLTIKTKWLGDQQNTYAYAVIASNYSNAIIKNCLLEGPSGTTTSLSFAGALHIEYNDVDLKLIQTEVHAGNLTTSTNTALSGISVIDNSYIKLVACYIDGGRIHSTSAENIQSRAIEASAGTIYAVSSYIWGGTAQNNVNCSTQGFFLSGNATTNIFSSVISGGYASSTSGIARSAAFAEPETGDQVSVQAFGCLLDGGIVESQSTTSYSACIVAYQSAVTMHAYGTIFSSATPPGAAVIRTPILFHNSLPELNNCVFAGFPNDAYNESTAQYESIVDVVNLIRISGTMTEFFRSYSAPYSYATFISNAWQPIGALAGLKSTDLPIDWGINEGGDLAGSFPNLIVDLANRLRPWNDFWTIGPYQN